MSPLGRLEGETLVRAGLSDRILVANADGTGLRRVPLVASPIEMGGVVAAGGDGAGDGVADMASEGLALMMAGESKPDSGIVDSRTGSAAAAAAAGLKSSPEVAESDMTST